MQATRFVAVLEQAAATGIVQSERIDTAGRPREIWSPRATGRTAGTTAGEKAERVKSPHAGDADTFSPLSPFPLAVAAAADSLPGRAAPSSNHGRTL